MTGLRVVALGGGHGLHTTLSALRRRPDVFAHVTAVVTVGRAVLALDCWEEVCPPDCKLVQADRVTMSNPSTAGLPKVVPGWLPLLFVAGQVVLVCKIFTFVSRI